MKIHARAGDTLASLAQRYNLSVGLLERLNGRNPGDELPPGLEIYLPSQSSNSALPQNESTSGQFPANGTKQDRFLFLIPHIVLAARRNGVDPYLLTTVCDIETQFQPGLTSRKGARGLTQLMPGTAARFGVSDAYDFRQALDGGAKYLRFLTDLFNGNLDLILAGYNSGEGNVIKYGRRVPPFEETQGYVARGRAAYLRYLQAQFGNLNSTQLGANVHTTSYTRPVPSSYSGVGEGSSEDAAEAPLATRSLVYGEAAETTGIKPQASVQAQTESPHVTRSIKYQ